MGDLYLIHRQYASEYYDPVKAHEYYMRNRELKGRKASSQDTATRRPTLNEKGQEAKTYVKKQLDEEKKSKLDAQTAASQAARDKHKSANEAAENKQKTESEKAETEYKQDIARYSQEAAAKITALYEDLLSMSAFDRERNKEQIASEILKLKEANNKKRAEVESRYSSKKSSISSTYKAEKEAASNEYKQATAGISGSKKSIMEEYKNKYQSELDSIYANKDFIKTSTKKRKKS